MAMTPLDDELDIAHDINVVPFIDVVLVLLIIFMVAAPLATVSIPVDLPNAASTPQEPPKDPIYITLQEDMSLLVGEDVVDKAELVTLLEDKTEGDHKQRIYIRADKVLPYGDVMELLVKLQKGGFAQVALVGMDKSQ